MWSPWARDDPLADADLEVATIVDSSIYQPLKGGRLMVIYLAEKVCYQLAGKDTPLVSIDPLVFMLAPRSMTNEEYDLWGLGIPFTN